MNADTTITATFTKTQTLTVTKDGTGTGSVSGDAGIDCGDTCSATVDREVRVLRVAQDLQEARARRVHVPGAHGRRRHSRDQAFQDLTGAGAGNGFRGFPGR